MATAEFSKFAGILSAALSQHHLSGFEIALLDKSKFSFNHECYHFFTPNWRFCPGKEESVLGEDYSHSEFIVGHLC